ncbi:hypothetical protein F751_4501 [Auxenochlorella protothecoides]|uniref:Uncharacterized protein n=1 Tax=Auxenochlorella protothecoides TaxID=3075 RepID=A0A087SNC7_AUXPR|nr:hypothetical protein F751_4501 [Auxenochlorella protothecoides]KFM27231.1 hypothetical protein F751_4501 [Auxenochlorella protothecoides]
MPIMFATDAWRSTLTSCRRCPRRRPAARRPRRRSSPWRSQPRCRRRSWRPRRRCAPCRPGSPPVEQVGETCEIARIALPSRLREKHGRPSRG